MRKLRCILALGAFFVLAAGLSACGSGLQDNAVVDMAGNSISTTAFNHWMFVAAKGNASQTPGQPVIVPNDPPEFKGCITQVRKQIPGLAKTTDKQLKTECGTLFTSLSGTVLDFLIKAYWYQAEASRLHIKVTDADVQKALQTAKKQQFHTDAEFNTYLTQYGLTLQDVLFRVRYSEILKKLIAKHQATVTPAQLQAYYKTHLTQFGSPETRDIRIVRTNTLQQANAAKAALASGQSFAAVAKKDSVDKSTKDKGGLLSGVTKGEEEAALDKAAFAAPASKVLGPIHGSFGYYVFEVTKIKPSTQQSFAQATPLIEQILKGQSQTSAQTAVDNQAKKQWLQKTTCRTDYAVADCRGYKPPKTTSTAAPQTAPPATTSATPPSTSTSAPSTTTTKK